MILTEEIREELEADGYMQLKVIDNKICGLMNFVFTIGLCVNITKSGFTNYWMYEYRYCYPNEKAGQAVLGLNTYDGINDPIGGWIKQKGGGIDRVNPNLEEKWIQ